MRIRVSKRVLACAGVAAAIMSASPLALASGYRTPFESSSGLGTVYAGGAASVDDAGTEFYNPAGLVRLPNQQLVASFMGVMPSIMFRGTATAPNQASGQLAPFSQTGLDSSGVSGIVPALHYALPLSDRMAFGFGINSPFGLVDEYDSNGLLRYTAGRSILTTVDLSPSLGYRVTDKFSVGFGIDAQRASRNLTLLVNTIIPGTFGVSNLEEDSDSWGYGAHAGLLYEFAPSTRVGLAFRSQIVQQLRGTSTFISELVTGGVSRSSNFRTTVTMPAITTASIYHELTPVWALMGSIEFTNWSAVKGASLQNVATVTPLGAPTTFNIFSPLNYRNTWRYSVGTSYQVSPKWKLRAGIATEQTPTNNTTRTVRLLDQNQINLGLGAHYQPVANLGFDAGYARAVLRDAYINQSDAISSVRGTGKITADVIGLQAVWNIS